MQETERRGQIRDNSKSEKILMAASKRILYLPHAVRQMSMPDRMISPDEVRGAVEHFEIIEDYPSDPRGHSCLLFYSGIKGRPVHVVCAPKEDYLAVITAYIPDSLEWENNFKHRKQK